MKQVLAIILLAVSAFIADAQVQVLWQTMLTNRTANVACMDGVGDTFVGGAVSILGDPLAAGFVTKLGRKGRQLWEYSVSTNVTSGVEALALDSKGNLFITLRPSEADPRPYELIKLSPDGQKLWKRVEYFAPSAVDYYPASTVKVDPWGNCYFLKLLVPADGFGGSLVLSKYSWAGRTLWRHPLPGHFVLNVEGLGRALSLTPAGEPVIAAIHFNGKEFSGVVAEFDWDGRLKWWTSEDRNHRTLPSFTSVLAGEFGTICAAAPVQGYVVLGPTGCVLTRGNTFPGIGAEVTDLAPYGGFLLTYDVLAELDLTGRLLWRSILPGCGVTGAVPDARGWLAISSGPCQSVSVSQVDWFGRRLWNSELDKPANHGRILNAVLAAPDGSARFVGRTDGGSFVRSYRP